MKSFAAIAAFAGAVVAQTLPEGSCSQLCINNMARIAQTEFSCTAGDASCFCTRSNWAYGVRDCSREACDAEQSAAAISYAALLCAGAEGPNSALPILTSALASSIAAAPSAGASVTESVASRISSAVESAGSVASSLAASASSAAASAISSAESVAASATSSAGGAVESLTNSLGSAIESATDAAGSAIESATDAAGSAVESATGAPDGEGAAAQQTALPLLAGAGALAMFFL